MYTEKNFKSNEQWRRHDSMTWCPLSMRKKILAPLLTGWKIIFEFPWGIIYKLSHNKYSPNKLKISHTWRSFGIDGAGKENRPRATTAWNSHRGTNTILHNITKSKDCWIAYKGKKINHYKVRCRVKLLNPCT